MQNLMDLKITKEQIAQILIGSVREKLTEILTCDNLHSTEVTELYATLYCDRIGKYKTDTLSKVLRDSVNADNGIFFVQEIEDFLETTKEEELACKMILDAIENYIIGSKDTLEGLISEPLTDKEINELSLIQTILIDFYGVLTNPEYQKRAKEIIVNRLSIFLEKQKEEVDYLKEKMLSIQEKMQKKGTWSAGSEVDKTMSQILQFCGQSEEDIKNYEERRSEAKMTNTSDAYINSLNDFTKSVFGKELITKELWDKVEKGLKDGSLTFDEESIDKIMKELDSAFKKDEE